KKMATHVDRSTSPYSGPLQMDVTAVAPLLRDISKGGRRGLRTAGPGIDDVVTELATAMPTAGIAAGVSQVVYQSFLNSNANVVQLRQVGQVVFKLAEVVAESLALTEDERENALSKIADIIRSSAKRDKNAGIAAPFQKTLAYKSRAANKA